MDCREFDDRLDALLDGGLNAEEREAIEAHAAGCPRCGKLLALLDAELEVEPVEPPAGFAEAVLERTSGAPCARAQEAACELLDGSLEPAAAGLLRLHLERCPECGPVARALARLAEALPALAETAPGAGFVERVLARTSRSWPRRLTRWRERAAGGWRGVLARPRFAAEGAYLGSLLIAGLVLVPGSPLGGLPTRALAATRVPIPAPLSALSAPVHELRARATELEARARASVEKRLAGPVETVERRADDAIGAIRAIGGELGRFVPGAHGRDDILHGDTKTPSPDAEKEDKEKRP